MAPQRSLKAMEKRLAESGARLDVVRGAADRTILGVAEAAGAGRVLWTRRYESAAIALDAGVKAALRERGAEAVSFNGRLMREPWELARADGAPAGTFTAFWRRHRALGALSQPLPAPASLRAAPWPERAPPRVPIDVLRLTPTAPDWASELGLGETPGEDGGLAALARFSADTLSSYPHGRELPAVEGASRLSAHLRFGEYLGPPGGRRGGRGFGRRPAPCSAGGEISR